MRNQTKNKTIPTHKRSLMPSTFSALITSLLKNYFDLLVKIKIQIFFKNWYLGKNIDRN
jgi:hypothetical protein